MIKFIIEVDEEFISSNADMNNKRNELNENFNEANAKDSIIKLLMCMPYNTINDEIKEGKTEFIVSSNYVNNDNKQQYESVVEHVALLIATNLLKERNKKIKEAKDNEAKDNDNKTNKYK